MLAEQGFRNLSCGLPVIYIPNLVGLGLILDHDRNELAKARRQRKVVQGIDKVAKRKEVMMESSMKLAVAVG